MSKIKNMVKGVLALALVALTANAWAAKQSITFTATTSSKVYDGSSLNADYNITSGSLKSRLGVQDKVESVSYDVNSLTDVGSTSYKITGVKIVGGKTGWGYTSEYNITYVGGTLTITPATITSMTLNEPTTLGYTGKDQTVTVGEVKAGNLTLSPSDYDITGNTASEVGVHTVTVTGKGNYQGTATATWEIKAHEHSWSYDVSTVGNVVTLTATCGASGCTLAAPYKTSATLTLSGGDKVYDGQAITGTLVKGEFETLTGITLGDVQCTGNATDAGTYKFSVSAKETGCDFSKSVTISQRDISDAVMTLSATSLPYSGADQTVTISSVTAGGLSVTYTEDADSVHTAKAIGTHTVKITANGNFTGAATANWTITNYSGSLKSLAAAQSGVGTISGNTLTVTDSSKLEYDSANQVWYAGLVLTWNVTKTKWHGFTAGNVEYTKPDTAQITVGDVTYNGTQSTDYGVGKIANATDTDTYEYASYKEPEFVYLKTTTWSIKITPQIIEEAKAAGSITASMYAGSLPFATGTDNTEFSNGIKFDTYTITVPIDENLKLYDEVKNQVYPDAGYVAQVADTKKKYTTLAAAIGKATAGQTVNAIAACEAGTFEIGQNITVNLAGFGNAEATYKFVNVTDEAMDAKVVSTKAENVTTEVTGFAVNNDNYTYTLYRAHQHLWEAVTSGATLTASCTNLTTECDIDGRATSITLMVTDNGDSNAPTFTVENKDAFLAIVNKYGEIASIGTVTAVRTTGDGAETTKWYVGNYTASCIVTVNGEEKTITKDFAIGGTLKDSGYSTSVGGLTIRYETFGEALAAAEAGSTIYYRGSDVSDESTQTLTFANVNKDITLDFGGKTFWYRGDADAYVSMSGTGTLTLQNIVLKQPRDKPSWGSYSYNDVVFSGGSFILGNNVTGASTDDKKLTLKAVNASVEVQAGLYKCSFWAGENGSVSLKGGEYWSNFNPADTTYVADGFVTVAATTEGYTYKVVPHEHNFYYVTDGNVITLRCEGAGYEGCDWTLNDNKLTLTAADALEGTTYTGASYTYDDSFLFDGDDPAIEYYKNGVKEDSTPSTCGSYEARVTVTKNGHTATAVKAFTIKHVHQFKYDIAPSATLTATCTNKVSDCDIEGGSTAIALTVTPNGDGVAPTFAIANKDAFLGFVNRDAIVASVGEITTVRNTDDGAETTNWYVGDYTSTCIVTISGVEYTLTANFSIAKPEGGYTSGWTVGSRDIRYNTWEEAQAVFVDGDTIYYRDDNRDFTEHKFSIGEKNLTLDFCGRTLKQASSISDMTIKSDGTGTLILQNVTIQQPKYLGISYQVSTEGNIVFGEGVKATNQADNKDRYLTITVNSGTLIVSNGLYQCGFATKSETETVNLRAGKYWENDMPALGQYNLADRACIEIDETIESVKYKYEIVEHVHNFAYTAEGNVITSVCDGEYKEGCYWYQNPQTATLTANDAAETAEPYAGASVAYTDLWVGSKELAITYWNGEEQLEGAPTRFGTYTAKITVGGATAEKSFTITPMAVTITVQNAEHATVKVYEGESEVTSQTEEYSVTHGNKVTAIYTADEDYAPTAVTNVLASAEDGDTIVAPVFTLAAIEFTPLAPENASVTKVWTNGVELASPYKVAPGTVVTVEYTANEGYLFANKTATMTSDITVSEAGDQPAPEGTETTKAAAKVGTEYYLTLKEAVGVVPDKGLVTLCKDAEGDGIVITGDKVFSLDLGTYTYTVVTNPVGSAGTETLGFQILAGATVDIKNGTITSAKGSGVKMLVQNYATLVVNGATLDGRNLDGTGKVYTLSNNNGFTEVIAYGEVIARGEGDIAMDACTFGSYDGTSVRLDGGQITGDIEVSWYAGTKPTHTVQLDLVAGIVTGKIVMDPSADNALVTVQNSGSVDVEIPEGWLWNESGILTKAAAKVGTTYYLTFVEAATNAVSGETVVLLQNAAGAGIFVKKEQDNLTFDFGGFTYTVTGPAVGSEKTPTQGFHIEAANCTLTNGTLTSASAAESNVKMLVQNYSNLTLADITLDGANISEAGKVRYVLSNCNGTTTIGSGVVINANAGDRAFDVDKPNAYDGANVTVAGATVNGDIELGRGGSLALNNGTINGSLVDGNNGTLAVDVTKSASVTLEAMEGYEWIYTGSVGKLTKKEDKPSIPEQEGEVVVDEEKKTVVIVPEDGTNTVEVSNAGDYKVIVPTTIDMVKGVDPTNIVVIASATNESGTVSVDITAAFTIENNLGGGAVIALNAAAEIDVKIGEKTEKVAVTPELGTAAGTEVAETPFVVTAEKVATGVKTIPGLTYKLLCGDSPDSISEVVKTIVAEDTRVVLEAAKGEDPKKFYKIEVAK